MIQLKIIAITIQQTRISKNNNFKLNILKKTFLLLALPSAKYAAHSSLSSFFSSPQQSRPPSLTPPSSPPALPSVHLSCSFPPGPSLSWLLLHVSISSPSHKQPVYPNRHAQPVTHQAEYPNTERHPRGPINNHSFMSASYYNKRDCCNTWPGGCAWLMVLKMYTSLLQNILYVT